jgi:hypothetical protein
MQVTTAQLADIPGIMSVLQENLLANRSHLSEATLSESGFLLHGFDAEELTQSIANKDHIILVAKENRAVMGYAIGYILSDGRPEWFSRIEAPESTLTALTQHKILHYRHIAKIPGTKQVGTSLLNSLVKMAQAKQCRYIIAEIAKNPLHNQISTVFHEKMGFRLVGVVRDNHNILHYNGLYLKML